MTDRTVTGAPSLALDHYRTINVKQIQNDTLSHFILSRASLFSLSSTGDLTYSSECLESSQIYMNNSQEVGHGRAGVCQSANERFARLLSSSSERSAQKSTRRYVDRQSLSPLMLLIKRSYPILLSSKID